MRGQTALYRLFSAEDALLYVGISRQFGDRWKQHAAEHSWWPEVRHQTITWYDTYKEADQAETAAIGAEKPRYNIAKVPREWTKDPEIQRRLRESQVEFESESCRVRRQRQEAVMTARAAGWSKYRIAAVLNVCFAAVTAIIKAAEREQKEDGGS